MRRKLLGMAVIALSVAAISTPAEARHKRHRIDANGNAVTFIGHPAGCPASLFCGCGASVRVFGHSVRSLWPSCAWFDGRFPRVSREAAQSGDVAGHCGHVFVLENRISGNVWMVTDYNSGGHHSRLHPRSIAGLKVVRPSGGRLAGLQ